MEFEAPQVLLKFYQVTRKAFHIEEMSIVEFNADPRKKAKHHTNFFSKRIVDTWTADLLDLVYYGTPIQRSLGDILAVFENKKKYCSTIFLKQKKASNNSCVFLYFALDQKETRAQKKQKKNIQR